MLGAIPSQEDVNMTRTWWRLAVSFALVAGLALVVSGCKSRVVDRQEGPVGVYVGKINRSEAYIALVSDGRDINVYISDSDGISIWVRRASLTDGRTNLVNRASTQMGHVDFKEDLAEGGVSIDRRNYSFTAERARGSAGLYRATKGDLGQPGSVEAGWIVLNDGTQSGNASVWSGAGDPALSPSPPLDLELLKAPVGSAGELSVERVSKPFLDPKLP
jgi:hypothetical protein